MVNVEFRTQTSQSAEILYKNPKLQTYLKGAKISGHLSLPCVKNSAKLNNLSV